MQSIVQPLTIRFINNFYEEVSECMNKSIKPNYSITAQFIDCNIIYETYMFMEHLPLNGDYASAYVTMMLGKHADDATKAEIKSVVKNIPINIINQLCDLGTKEFNNAHCEINDIKSLIICRNSSSPNNMFVHFSIYSNHI